MITVILQFQFFYCFFLSHAVCLSKFLDLILEHHEQLVLRYAAKCVVSRVIADVIRLVESAENTDLRELSHTCKQHELKMFVSEFEHAVETF